MPSPRGWNAFSDVGSMVSVLVRMRNAFAAIAFIVVLQPVHAATLRVPTQFATIQAAIDAAAVADTVRVAPGVYPENVDFLGKAIALISEQGPKATTIDGRGLGPVIRIEHSERRPAVVEGFTIANGVADFGAGMLVFNAAVEVRRNIFVDNTQREGGLGAAIGIRSGLDSPIIESNEFARNACDGQFTSSVLFIVDLSPRIFNNVFHDNPCRAIHVSLSASPLVYNNTLVRNRIGVTIDARGSNPAQVYQNNLIVGHDIGLEAVFFNEPLSAAWRNNLFFGNVVDVAGTADPTGSAGNLRGDPQFIDGANAEFDLSRSSPAIDAGSSAGIIVPPADFEFRTRVTDGNGDGVAAVDMGALEASSEVAAQVGVPVPVGSWPFLAVLGVGVLLVASRHGRR